MPKEDYLIKFIEKLSRVIAAMLGMRQKGLPEDSVRLADEAYREMLDTGIEELDGMPEDEFEVLIKAENYNPDILGLLVEIVVQTAHAYFDMKEHPQALAFYRKSLRAYEILTEKDKTFSFEREQAISGIKSQIELLTTGKQYEL